MTSTEFVTTQLLSANSGKTLKNNTEYERRVPHDNYYCFSRLDFCESTFPSVFHIFKR